MSESDDSDSSMLVDDDDEEDEEDEEEHELEDDVNDEEDEEFGDAETDDDKELYCDQLQRAMKRLFEILMEGKSMSAGQIEMVKCLLQKYPDAADFDCDKSKGYPLHLACRREAPLEVIEPLVKAFPRALRLRRWVKGLCDDFEFEFWMCPLQQALCNAKVSFGVIRFLVSQWPKALSLRSGGHYALHIACEANVSLQIIQYLVQQNPETLQLNSELGTPLHHACYGGADLSIINFLIQLRPVALQVPNKMGSLPLREACRCRNKFAEVSVWSTYRKNQSLAAATASTDRTSSLNLSVASPPPPPPPLMVLQTLVQAWPAAARIRDKEGFLPLHHLCWSHETNVLLADVELLVAAWPYALRVATTKRGMLPLHVACQYQVSTDVILFLIESYPLAAKVRNKRGELPLHIMAAASEKLDVAVLERLIQVWPSSVLVPCDCIEPPAERFAEFVMDLNDILKMLTTTQRRRDSDSSSSMEMEEDADGDSEDSHGMFMSCEEDSDDDSSHAISVQVQEDDDGDEEEDDEDNDDGSRAMINVQDQEDDSDEEDDRDIHQAETNSGPWRRLALDIVCEKSTAEQPLTMEIALLLTNGTPPLHFACSQRCNSWFPYRMQTLEKLAELSTSEDWRHFHQGMLPLHCACRARADQNILLWLGEKYPDALRTCTTDTMDSPLHCYLSSSFTRTTATTTSVHPNATTSAMTHDDDDCESKSQPSPLLAIVQYLVEQNPAALHSANRSGWLPIHLAAAMHHNATASCLDILFYLARQCPESLVPGNPLRHH